MPALHAVDLVAIACNHDPRRLWVDRELWTTQLLLGDQLPIVYARIIDVGLRPVVALGRDGGWVEHVLRQPLRAQALVSSDLRVGGCRGSRRVVAEGCTESFQRRGVDCAEVRLNVCHAELARDLIADVFHGLRKLLGRVRPELRGASAPRHCAAVFSLAGVSAGGRQSVLENNNRIEAT